MAIGRIGAATGPLMVAPLLGDGRGSGQVLISLLPMVLIAGSAAVAMTFRPRVDDRVESADPTGAEVTK